MRFPGDFFGTIICLTETDPLQKSKVGMQVFEGIHHSYWDMFLSQIFLMI